MCFHLGRSVSGASYYFHTRIHSNQLITRLTPHDHTNPLLAPVFLGFVSRDLVGVCIASTSPVGAWGIVIFSDANPHLPPPQPVLVVVRDYIDRCIMFTYCSKGQGEVYILNYNSYTTYQNSCQINPHITIFHKILSNQKQPSCKKSVRPSKRLW